MTKWLWLTTLLGVFMAAGCSGDDGSGPVRGNDDAGLASDSGTDATPDASTTDLGPSQDLGPGDDSGLDGGSDGGGPACGPDEKVVGEQCFPSASDRCDDESDCRDWETCTQGRCRWVAPPDARCPGGEGCQGNDGPLTAGAAALTITPRGFELPRPEFMDRETFTGSVDDPGTFFDCGRDMICPGDEGYAGPDEDGSEGNGHMEGVWIAGFGPSRPALEVHDDQWVRCVVFGTGETRVAVAALDLIGFFFNEIEEIRESLDPTLGIDLLVVSSTHTHEGYDALGQWGPDNAGGTSIPVEPGTDPAQQAYIRERVRACVEQAVQSMEEAELFVATRRTGIDGLANDTRDPFIIDDTLTMARFARTSDGGTIATLINWGSPPEALWVGNNAISSDFPHWVREGVEQGLAALGDDPARDGLGGVAVYVSGAVGGLVTPGHIVARDRAGREVRGYGFEFAQAIGERLAAMVLDGLGQADLVEAPRVSFLSRQILLPVRNMLFQLAFFTARLFDRPLYDVDPTTPLNNTNYPWVKTEIDLVRVGPLTLFTMPGEPFPETVVGFDPSYGFGRDVVSPDNPNPPDLEAAPTAPPLREIMPGEHVVVLGLGNDEVGYLVPPYDFQLGSPPYLSQAPGDHYEETNSLGEDALPLVEDVIRDLVGELGAGAD